MKKSMMTSRLKKILAILLMFLSAQAQASEKFLLKDFIQEVLESNPTLQAAQFRAEALGFRIKPAGTLDDPFFAVGPDEVPFEGEGSMIRYQINQTLPYPGKPMTRSKIAKAEAQAAQADSETTRRQLVVFATQAYYKAYFNQELSCVNAELRNLLSPLIETSKNKYVTGSSGAHHEWLLGKAELGVLKVEKLKLLREKIALQALLNELRNEPPETPIGSLSVSLNKKDLEIPDPIENQPELKSLNSLVQAAQQEKDLAKMGYIPDLMVQGMITQPQGMPEGMIAEPKRWGVMVGFNVPIFAYRKQAKLVAAAQKQKEVTLATRKSLENKLQTELTQARQEYETARDLVKLYEGSLLSETRLALNSAQSAYTSGAAPLSGVLNLLRIRLSQEQEYLAARLDLEMARLRVKELLSSPPLERFAPSSPTLFSGDSMSVSNMQMPSTSATGMGKNGMSGPAAKPQKMGTDSQGSGMGGMK